MIVRFAVSFAFLLNGAAFAQSIFTIAGGGTDDGRPATVAALYEPNSVAVDTAGNLYIVDEGSNRIRKVNARTGIIETVAGSGAQGFTGDGGPATDASFNTPKGVAVDSAGNVYIADRSSFRIRKVISENGTIITVVGRGEPCCGGDGGPATAASLAPEGVVVDAVGNLYILEHARVRRVIAASGVINTIAGTGTRGFSGDGGPATAAMLAQPARIAVDESGNVYIADTYNHRVRKVDGSSGIIATIAGTGATGLADDDGPATAATLSHPDSVAVDSAGDLYIADVYSRIRKISRTTGIITTIGGKGDGLFSGDGGPAISAALTCSDLAVDSARNLYIADWQNNRIRKIAAATEIITTVAGNGRFGYTGDSGPATAALVNPYDLAIDPAGNLYVADWDNHRVRTFNAQTRTMATVAGNGVAQDAGRTTDDRPATEAIVGFPRAVALDSSGNLYVASVSRIRKVDARSGMITTVAGTTQGFSGDGGPATAAKLNFPSAIAVDASGNLYLADIQNHRIRKVTAATGIITTIAGTGAREFTGDGGAATAAALNLPWDVALDREGNVYIADTWNHRVRMIRNATGIITTIVGNGMRGSSGDGGPASAASIERPDRIAFDASGNLHVTENVYSSPSPSSQLIATWIRRVSAANGSISTVLGGAEGYSGDNGPATAARLRPRDIAFDADDNIFIADGSNRIRVVLACVKVTSPALTSPASGSTGIVTSPRLAWSSVRGAFRYDVLLDTVSPPKQVAASDITTTTFAAANLQPLTTYYWQVVAKGDPFCVPFSQSASEVRSFTTAASCDAPGVPLIIN